jgi:hypothetical protein
MRASGAYAVPGGRRSTRPAFDRRGPPTRVGQRTAATRNATSAAGIAQHARGAGPARLRRVRTPDRVTTQQPVSTRCLQRRGRRAGRELLVEQVKDLCRCAPGFVRALNPRPPGTETLRERSAPRPPCSKNEGPACPAGPSSFPASGRSFVHGWCGAGPAGTRESACPPTGMTAPTQSSTVSEGYLTRGPGQPGGIPEPTGRRADTIVPPSALGAARDRPGNRFRSGVMGRTLGRGRPSLTWHGNAGVPETDPRADAARGVHGPGGRSSLPTWLRPPGAAPGAASTAAIVEQSSRPAVGRGAPAGRGSPLLPTDRSERA